MPLAYFWSAFDDAPISYLAKKEGWWPSQAHLNFLFANVRGSTEHDFYQSSQLRKSSDATVSLLKALHANIGITPLADFFQTVW